MRRIAAAGRRSRVTVIGLIDVRLNEIRLAGSVAAAEQSVSAAGAPAFAARHLSCDAGEPLLRIDRLYFDAGDTPVELAVSYSTPSTTPTASSSAAAPGNANRATSLGANSLIITVFGQEEQPSDGCEHALELVDRAAVAAAFPAEHPPQGTCKISDL